jgi:hypothetical protein
VANACLFLFDCIRRFPLLESGVFYLHKKGDGEMAFCKEVRVECNDLWQASFEGMDPRIVDSENL